MRKVSRESSVRQSKGVQIALSREERIAMIQDGLLRLSHDLGLMAAQAMLEAEITELCGPSHSRLPGREARRWGRQAGVITLGGRKVAIRRPRARLVEGREAELETYRRFQDPQAMPANALRLLLRGVSCRDYEGALEPVAEGFGALKSSISRHFVKATAKQLRDLAERRFNGQVFVAIFIDGVIYAGETLVAALGVGEKGDKIILGLRQGATENARVCKDLFEELRGRGLDTDAPTLFVLDGSKALRAAVKAVWGEQAVVQRCQVHKTRNVLEYLEEKHHEDIRNRMAEAYACKDWREGLRRLQNLANWLTRLNRDAAGSLREGLEETLTVARLGLPAMLAKSLVTTNPIESAFSVTKTLTRRVKRWRNGDMRLRWATAGLMRAETKFRRLKGFREIPHLVVALKREIAENAVDAPARAA